MNIVKIKDDQIDQITEFIYELNNSSRHHIGYCSKVKSEIKAEIIELIEDGSNFFAVYSECKLVAVIGYEKYDETVEVWGPFVLEKDSDNMDAVEEVSHMLWNEMLNFINDNSLKYYLHCNSENTFVKNFASEKGFKVITEGQTMSLNLEKLDIPIFENISIASEKHFTDFETLHDTIFPGTYYSGKEIIELLDQENILLIAEEDNKVIGYIYAKINSEIDDVYIDFIGVDSNYREKGYGKKLLYSALKIFKENGVKTLLLWVDKKNEAAIKLYKSIGFATVDNLIAYKL